LAHYTSVSVSEAILRNNEVWFSNPQFNPVRRVSAMDHYADDLAALTAHLDLARHGESRVTKAVIISVAPPLMGVNPT
jgi:hypothetical protein